MALKLITPPGVEPITVADIEAQCRATIAGDVGQEPLVESYIKAVRGKAESWLRRALITQEWELSLNRFPIVSCHNPFGAFIIPLPPLQSITSIKYIDLDGVEQTITPADYQVMTEDDPGLVAPAWGKAWPTPRTQVNAVRVRFVAGYGDTVDTVPEEVRAWMKINVANLYETRETIVIGTINSEITTLVDPLIAHLRVITF